MSEQNYKAYSYRWVVLSAYMLVCLVGEIQWLTHAPVARAAEAFYAGQFNPNSIFNIDFLAMSYMLVYLIVGIPASYVIDTWGIRKGIGFGAALCGISALLKGIFADSFTAQIVFQLALAISQPFLLNGLTALTARWFPLKERGTAAGLGTLSQFLGIIIVMMLTPLMVATDPGKANYGQGLHSMLMIYGVITFIACLAAIFLIKEEPPTPPSEEAYVRHKFTDGLKHILRQKNMWITILIFFIGLGIFNAVSSMTDSIAEYLKVKDSDGLIGGIMLIGGILGALILPILSDIFKKRKIFINICLLGMVPSLAGIAFAAAITPTPEAAYTIALISSFLLGFFVLSAGPIGFQYAAEITCPAPESTSQGLLLLSGQLTGLIFVAIMSARANTYLPFLMKFFVVIGAAALILSLFLKESKPLANLKNK
ncbi:MAG: MFS transporter [Candidatus Neomarinimicrobiota bacterium]|jgi:sugar phosphate permease|nr:MFS transporter [Candidatus Neomarinimicrobiota bacterium]MDD3966111.1 MFS transporter [Candidatus Neomarinimicrobiota bacterium]MDX9780705.1 MFS transporter [bacterium]